MPATLKRTVNVPQRRFGLTEQLADQQTRKGLFTVQRGERMPIPVDDIRRPTHFLNRDLWRYSKQHGVYRPGAKFPHPLDGINSRQKRTLAWLRDHVNTNIPYWYYNAVLGHDLHVSTYARLYGEHWHRGWANPFNPEQNDQPLDPTFAHSCIEGSACPIKSLELQMTSHWGFVENLGLLSQGKVTDAFVSEEIDELVSATASEYADFDSHEVGTDATAEDNNQTALIATSGIARSAGTPTDSDPIYQSAGTVTADTTETWEEHGLFNNTTGAALMDRSVTGGQSVEASDQVTYTYQLTKNPEA